MAPNRFAIVIGSLVALGAFITSLTDSFTSDTAKAAVAVTALIVFLVLCVIFLIGWQKHEERVQAGIEDLPDAQRQLGAPELDEGEDVSSLSELALPDEPQPDVSGAPEMPLRPVEPSGDQS